MNYRLYAKAIAGASLAGLTSAATAVTDGQITASEWIGIAISVIATGAGVFGVTNEQPSEDY